MQNIKNKLFLVFVAIIFATVLAGCSQSSGENLKISFDQRQYDLFVGDTVTLNPIVENGVIETANLVWSIEDGTVASCENGVVKALAEGNTRVNVYYVNDPSVSAIVIIKVTEVEYFPNVTFATVDEEMIVDSTQIILPTIEGTNFDAVVSYESLHEEIATVDENGLVTAIDKGATTIIVRIAELNNLTNYREYRFVINVVEPSYVIVYELNGGENNDNNVNVFKSRECPITLEEPTKEGYTFMGWYTDPECTTGNEIDTITASMTHNVTVYAKWEIINYEISYIMDPESYYEIPIYKIDSYHMRHVCIKDEQQAASEWWNYISFVETAYEGFYEVVEIVGMTVSLTKPFDYVMVWYNDIRYENVELYNYLNSLLANPDLIVGKWLYIEEFKNDTVVRVVETPLEATVDTLKIESDYYTIESSFSNFPTPVKTGHNFLGWVEVDSEGNVSEDYVNYIRLGSTGDIRLAATWELIDYEIKYNLNGGVGEETGTYNYDIENTYPLQSAPTRDGYTFEGWYDNDGFAGSPITEIPVRSTGTKEFFAKWSLDSYTISYDLNGGTALGTNPTEYNVELGEITLYGAEKQYYDFMGWEDADGNVYNKLNVDTLSNLELTAKFVPTEYLLECVGLTFNIDFKQETGYASSDGTHNILMKSLSQSVSPYWTVIVLKETEETNIFEVIECFYDPENFEVQSTDYDWLLVYHGEQKKSNPYTYHALESYAARNDFVGKQIYIDTTVSENLNAIIYEERTNYNVESDDITLPTLTRNGYEFVNWTDSESNVVSTIDCSAPKDITVEANWKLVNYKLSFDAKGGNFVGDYADRDEMVEDFMKDYNASQGTSYSAEQFANLDAYAEIISVTTFLYTNLNKWGWIVDYIQTVASSANVRAFNVFRNYTRYMDLYYEEESNAHRIAYEVRGFIGGIQYTKNEWYITADYSQDAIGNGFWDFVPTGVLNIEKGTSSLPSAYKNGYNFLGWYDSDGNKVGSAPANTYEDITLYAKWVGKIYTVSYELNGGTGLEEETYTTNAANSFTLQTSVTKPGYTFAGWYDNIELSGTQVTELVAGTYGDKQYYAKWTLAEYTITYNADGGYIPTVYESADDVIADFLADYNAYSSKSHTAATFAELGSWAEISTASNFLYANLDKWGWFVDYIAGVASSANKKAYQVFKDYSGQTQFNNANTNYIYSIAYELRGFVGQFKYTKNDSYHTADYSDSTISNKWMEYMPVMNYNIESETFTLVDALKPGYDFLGWFDANDNEVTEIAKGTYGNIVLTAKWEESVYEITFDAKGGTMIPVYASYEDVVTDFLKDYNAYSSKSHTAATFAELGSWDEISTASKFLYANLDKWGWLVDYIAGVASSANKHAFDVFKDYTSQSGFNAENGNNIYSVAYELRGFVGQVKYTKNANFITADYSNESIRNSIWNHIMCNEFTITDEIILPIPEKDGYAFGGWYTQWDSDNSVVAGAKVASYSSGTYGHIKLFAKWIEQYEISYELYGGSFNEYPIEYATKDDMIADFIKDVNSTCGLSVTNPQELHSKRGSYSNTFWQTKEMYAKWKWMLEYFADLAHEQFSSSGYQYYDNMYNGGNGVLSHSGYFSQSVSIYLLGINAAQWNENYSSTYGDLSSKWTTLDFTAEDENEYQNYMIFAPRKYTVESDDITLIAPTKDGYIFQGWYETSSFEGDKVTKVAAGSTGDVKLYAKWVLATIFIGDQSYTTFDDAIAAASDNDVITLKGGEYTLGSKITKSLTFSGSNAATCIINVTKDVAGNVNANNIKFENVTLKGVGANVAGVYFQNNTNTKTITFDNCIITNMNTLIKFTSTSSNNITVNITNCTINNIGQFIVWVTKSMETVNFIGNNVDLSTCGGIANSAAALLRIRSGSATVYDNVFTGDVKNIAGIFESSANGITVKYNTFKNVTKYVYVTDGKTLTFDKNLYLDSSDNVLSTVPTGVSGTGVTADTTLAASEAERENYYNNLA